MSASVGLRISILNRSFTLFTDCSLSFTACSPNRSHDRGILTAYVLARVAGNSRLPVSVRVEGPNELVLIALSEALR